MATVPTCPTSGNPLPPPTHRATLRTLRQAASLSQRELAAAAGLSKATITKLEAGRHTARPATLRKLAAALEVEPSALADLLRRRPAERSEQP